MTTTIRDWLFLKPYDGTDGRRALTAVELDDDGDPVDTLVLFDGARCVVGFSGTAKNNMRLAKIWCAEQRSEP